MAETVLRTELKSAAVNRNPFPGLRPFRPDEEHLFFGRESQVDHMVDKLAARRFLAVVGTSGSGKSSLVNCGLRPALHRGYMAIAGSAWRMAQFRPGDNPLGAMAQALARPGVLFDSAALGGMPHEQLIEATLRLGSLGLVDIVEQARLAQGENLLLVVDQFEELFRFRTPSSKAAAHDYGPAEDSVAFVRMLLEAAGQRDLPIYVVLTMRSDFLGECAQFHGLPDAINEGQYLVPRLTRDEIRAAITGPVSVAYADVSPVLLTRLLNDVGDNPDQLPILQHALNRTWANWEGEGGARGALDLVHYEAIGGMQHALDRHAEKAFAELSNVRDQRLCERVFKVLADKGTDPRGIRRPTQLSSLCAITGAAQSEVVAVIDRFRKPSRSFLMPPLAETLEPKSVIDISHESFMRLWERLAKWANEEAESRVMLLRVVEAARLYGQQRGGLWRDPELKQALNWRQETNPTSPWVGFSTGADGEGIWKSVTGFLDDSFRAARSMQTRRRLWVALAGAVTVVVVGLAIRVAFDASARHKNIAAELTNRALLEVDRDPVRSAHFAKAALDQDSANADAEAVLRRAVANLELAYTERILSFDHPVTDARYSRDGARLAIASGNTVTLFDTRTFEKEGLPYERDGPVWSAWLIADNTNLLTLTEDYRVQMQRIGDSTVRDLSCLGKENGPTSVAVSPDERYVGVGCLDGAVHVWEVAYPDRDPQEFGYAASGGSVTALTFSADGKYLASGDRYGIVNIWKVGRPGVWIGGGEVGADQAPRIAHDGRESIRDIAFHPNDDTLLVTAGDDAEAIVWQLDHDARKIALDATKQPTFWKLKHDRPVIRAFFTNRSDGTSPAVTISDKAARLWENDEIDSKQVRGHEDWVTDANVSNDGELLVTASSDATARIWSTRSGTPLAVLRGHLNSIWRVMFSPDGEQVVTASEDGTARVWRFQLPRVLLSEKHWILSAVFEPGGSRIAVGEEGPGAILDASDDGVGVREDLTQKKQEDMVSGLSWSRDRKFLFGLRNFIGLLPSYAGNQVVLWDVQSKGEITPDWLSGYWEAKFGTGTDEFLTVNRDGQLAIWKSAGLASGEMPVPEVKEFGEGYFSAAISPDGKWIAAASISNTTVDLWRRGALEEGPRVLEGHSGDLMSLEFSPDSQRLVTASRDRSAIIWSVESGAPMAVFADSQSAVLASASFDPSGTRVATGGSDGIIRVWDVSRGNVLAVFRWDSEAVNQVQFSADGRAILSASDDGTVTLGQCEVCVASLAKLIERVPELADPSGALTKKITDDIELVKTQYKMSAFLKWLGLQ